MNDLCVDIGFKSVNHYGEQLCGDHLDVVEQGENSRVIVLADGLGSGVKASILSTLTSKIISTMMSEGLSLEESVQTIVKTLPVCSVRGVAYSTFTIVRIVDNVSAEIIEFDNPKTIILRDGKNFEYNRTEMVIEGKKVYNSTISLKDGDVFIVLSDGCPHAGIGNLYNFGWKREEIADYMLPVVYAGGYSAKSLATILIDEVNKLYDYKPGDDATACIIKVRKRQAVNILFGPPSDRDDTQRMMSLFFSKEGKHIVCGGTTSSIVAKFLNKPLKTSLSFDKSGIPPIAEIEGVDLVTEGVITMNKVVEYAKDAVGDNNLYEQWGFGHDGASLICRLLFEEATDINFYVGRAVNPAHQNPDLPINFNIKMTLVEELSKCLKQMGKRIRVNYF
ncbi:MAG TPA: serine/threonine protein phosphatase [Clostridiales bacterium]|nr:serine/threonine protein phosphatase [Clostridiales bacterium]